MKKLRSVLLFSGYNQRAIIAFCRFANINNIDFRIVANKISDPIFLSCYKSKVIAVREKDTLSIPEIIEYRDTITKNSFDQLIILPSTEYLNRFLVSNKTELEQNRIIVPLVDKFLYETISDKYSFGKICKNFCINIPHEIEIINDAYPIVAKPKKYIGNNGKIYNPLILNNQSEYKKFYQNFEYENFYLQEFVAGKSYYLLFYFSTDNTYSVYSQENFIQQSDGRSIIAAQSSLIHNNEITDEFVALFFELKFYGLVMIELKYYQDKFYMIEANPRLWGPSQLILDANMNLFQKFALEFGLISNCLPLEYKPFEKYYWSGGIIQDQQKSNKLAFHNYNRSIFFEEISSFAINDVYARDDTVQIYLEELKIKRYE